LVGKHIEALPPLAGCYFARRRIAVMTTKPNGRQKKTPKRILRLRELDHLKKSSKLTASGRWGATIAS
jgi:hypothetical protein